MSVGSTTSSPSRTPAAALGIASARPWSVVQSKTGLMGASLGFRIGLHGHGSPGAAAPASARASDRPHGREREVCPMRGSDLIWTIVGVLLIIALLIFILDRV